MKTRERVKVWDLPLRLFHWTLVIAIAVAFLSSQEDSGLNEWHVFSGWVAAILIAFRLAWWFVGGEHSRFADFVHPTRIRQHISGLLSGRREPELGHNPLGAIAVVILLALIAVTVWTGASSGEAAEGLHELFAWTLLAMVAVHIGAVVAMSLLNRENLVRAMLTGDKLLVRHPGASEARPPSAAGWIIGIVVIVGAACAVLRYDPHAFTLRSAEAFAQRTEPSAVLNGH